MIHPERAFGTLPRLKLCIGLDTDESTLLLTVTDDLARVPRRRCCRDVDAAFDR